MDRVKLARIYFWITPKGLKLIGLEMNYIHLSTSLTHSMWEGFAPNKHPLKPRLHREHSRYIETLRARLKLDSSRGPLDHGSYRTDPLVTQGPTQSHLDSDTSCWDRRLQISLISSAPGGAKSTRICFWISSKRPQTNWDWTWIIHTFQLPSLVEWEMVLHDEDVRWFCTMKIKR